MSWRERTRGLEAKWLDPALAVVALVAVEIELLSANYRRGPIVLNALLIAGMTLPLAWRRRYPLSSALILLGAALVETLALTKVTTAASTMYVLFVPPYAIAAWLELPRAVIGLAACLAAGLTASIASADAQTAVSSTIFVTLSWTVGRAIRARRLLAKELELKAARAEAEREDRARLAVADERSRIARELHAVVARSVSAMVVGAEAAVRSLDDDINAADEQIAEVERTGRQALDEMRRILGVLRAQEGPEREPQAGIGQLPALVERGRSSGLAIELRAEGEPAPVPTAVDLTAYRIVQESLANSLEHATGQASVIVRYRDGNLELELHDDGPFEGRIDEDGAARLRERVATFGGDVRWGPDRGGGFALRATLPSVFEEVGVS